MAVVMIGVDPHKASHTAVAISAAEQSLGQLRVELLSRPVDQDLLGGVFPAFLGGPLGEFSVDEGRSGADQGDEVGGVDGAPAVLR